MKKHSWEALMMMRRIEAPKQEGEQLNEGRESGWKTREIK